MKKGFYRVAVPLASTTSKYARAFLKKRVLCCHPQMGDEFETAVDLLTNESKYKKYA